MTSKSRSVCLFARLSNDFEEIGRSFENQQLILKELQGLKAFASAMVGKKPTTICPCRVRATWDEKACA